MATALIVLLLPFTLFSQQTFDGQWLEVDEFEVLYPLEKSSKIKDVLGTNTVPNATTNLEMAPRIDLRLNSLYEIHNLYVDTKSRSNSIIVAISSNPLNDIERDDLINTAEIAYFKIANSERTGELISIDPYRAQYVTIFSASPGEQFTLNEFRVQGFKESFYTKGFRSGKHDGTGPGGPGTGPGPFRDLEKCDDNKDNDLDTYVDCDDLDCKVYNITVFHTDPSCPVCTDGEIRVAATNDRKISIDGGQTWVNSAVSGQTVFSGLGVGTYTIVLATDDNLSCQVSTTIDLTAPTGGVEVCENGSWEMGTYDNWLGGIGSNFNGSPVFGNTTFHPDRHAILSSSAGWTDPNISFINSDLSALGSYTLRLGDLASGRGSERATYCFTVDQDNSAFKFFYATVLQNPNENHSALEKPFFQYRLYVAGDSDNNVEFFKVTAEDPFLQQSTSSDGAVGYKGWTCVEMDLSDYVGKPVCIEFIVADCTQGAHAGYAYIDGLCENQSDLLDDVKLVYDTTYCGNEAIRLDVEGTGFDRYSWRISEVDDLGNVLSEVSTNVVIGYEPPAILDLVSYYEMLSGKSLTCGTKLKVEFFALSNCNSRTIEATFDYICEEYNIDYCNDVFFCGSFSYFEIPGVNDCSDCDVRWSPSQYFVDPTEKFGRLNAIGWTMFILGQQDYQVAVTTPEGCVYREDIKVHFDDNFTVSGSVDYKPCQAIFTTVIDIDIPTSGSAITYRFVDRNTGEILGTHSGTGTSLQNQFVFENSFSRVKQLDIDVVVIIDFSHDSNNGDPNSIRCAEGGCRKRYSFESAPRTPFGNPWRVYTPNIFHPTEGPNDLNNVNSYFEPYVFSGDVDNCSIDQGKSSFYKVELDIFDRWGGLMHSATSEAQDVKLGPGVECGDVRWFGKVNNEVVSSGTYTYVLKLHSCWSVAESGPTPCGCNDDSETCGVDPVTIIAGDITVIQ